MYLWDQRYSKQEIMHVLGSLRFSTLPTAPQLLQRANGCTAPPADRCSQGTRRERHSATLHKTGFCFGSGNSEKSKELNEWWHETYRERGENRSRAEGTCIKYYSCFLWRQHVSSLSAVHKWMSGAKINGNGKIKCNSYTRLCNENTTTIALSFILMSFMQLINTKHLNHWQGFDSDFSFQMKYLYLHSTHPARLSNKSNFFLFCEEDDKIFS